MADNLGLDRDEIVLLKETSVAHGGVMAIYTDELILTNKKLMCINKGMFGGTKQIYHYPLSQIKTYNGIPQVQMGKLSNGLECLDVYLLNGEEHFNFQSKNKKTINLWIKEVHKLFNSNSIRVTTMYDESDEDDEYEETKEDDDSVLGAFKEVGEEFKDVGREIAEAFGFKVKKKAPESKNKKAIGTAQKSDIICASCGKPMSASSKFCPTCGASAEQLVSSTMAVIQAEKTCVHCGKKISANSKFCSSCGNIADSVKVENITKNDEKVCKYCGKKLNPNLKFCTECGNEIETVAVLEEKVLENEVSNSTKDVMSIDKQIELLEKLKSLADAGVISQEEFEMKKKEIFN